MGPNKFEEVVIVDLIEPAAKRSWPEVSIATVIEVAAALSIITLIAGFIWVHVVLAVANAPGQPFTVVDYIASGTSISLLVSSVSLSATLSYAITFPWERAIARTWLRRIMWFAIAASILAVFIIAVSLAFFDVDNPRMVLLSVALSSFLRAISVIALFLVVLKLGLLRAQAINLCAVVALAVWVNSVSGALAYGIKARRAATPAEPLVTYAFENARIDTHDWYPLLTTEKFYYFVERATGKIKVLPADALQEISQN